MKFFIRELRCEEDIPVGSAVKTLPVSRRPRFDPWVGKIPQRRKWQSTPLFLPRESYGQRSLAGYSPWGHKSWTWLNDKQILLYNTVTVVNLSRKQRLESNGITETCSISEKKLRNREHRHLPETVLWQWCTESPKSPTSIERVYARPCVHKCTRHLLTALGRKVEEGLEGFSIAGIPLLMLRSSRSWPVSH